MERICPLLALAVDRRTVIDGPDAGHRCHAGHQADPVDRGRQLQLCLGDGYARCERFREHVEASGDPRLTPLAAGGRFVPTRVVITPEPAWAAIASSHRRLGAGRLIGAGLASALAGAVGVAVASGALGPDPLASLTASPAASSSEATLSGVSGTPSAAPTQSPAATGSAAPTVAPTATPEATAVPTVQPSTPTPAPTAVPQPVTYTVAAGDTLSRIAAEFGTTVQALMAANGIEDPDLIEEGQTLVIP